MPELNLGYCCVDEPGITTTHVSNYTLLVCCNLEIGPVPGSHHSLSNMSSYFRRISFICVVLGTASEITMYNLVVYC